MGRSPEDADRMYHGSSGGDWGKRVRKSEKNPPIAGSADPEIMEQIRRFSTEGEFAVHKYIASVLARSEDFFMFTEAGVNLSRISCVCTYSSESGPPRVNFTRARNLRELIKARDKAVRDGVDLGRRPLDQHTIEVRVPVALFRQVDDFWQKKEKERFRAGGTSSTPSGGPGGGL